MRDLWITANEQGLLSVRLKPRAAQSRFCNVRLEASTMRRVKVSQVHSPELQTSPVATANKHRWATTRPGYPVVAVDLEG
jgi:hypothetical protein